MPGLRHSEHRQTYVINGKPIFSLPGNYVGRNVPDISFNAVANLGYADLRFHLPAYPGMTLRADSEVIGLREASSGKAGVVHVRSECRDQDGRLVLEWVRWVLVSKRDPGTATRPSSVNATLYVTNGRSCDFHVRHASFWRRASKLSSSSTSNLKSLRPVWLVPFPESVHNHTARPATTAIDAPSPTRSQGLRFLLDGAEGATDWRADPGTAVGAGKRSMVSRARITS